MAKKFSEDLTIRVIDGGLEYELTDDFYYYREGHKEDTIVVPKGFRTDFASIPRVLWSLFPPAGGGTPGTNYGKCAVLHDFLCVNARRKQLTKVGENLVEINRKDADDIFLESMKAMKVNWFTRNIFYINVRLYGIIMYNILKRYEKV